MQTLSRVLKRAAEDPPLLKDEKDVEEHKALRTSVQNLEKEKLFSEYKVLDAKKDVQTRDELLREKDKHIEGLLKEKQKQIEGFLPLYQDNLALKQRNKDLEDKLVQAVKDKQAAESRLEKQADALAAVHQKRMGDARTASMNVINDCLLKLRVLFLKRNSMSDEEVLAEFVCLCDAVRTTVGINLC